jgi:hypothetical protein
MENRMILSDEKIEQAKKFATIRQNCASTCKHDSHSKSVGSFIHLIGICGEMAFCDFLGIDYIFTNKTFKSRADVVYLGVDYEVKASRGWTYCIKKYESTKNIVFVKLSNDLTSYTILGQIQLNELLDICGEFGIPQYYDDGSCWGWRINYREIRESLVKINCK